MDKSEALIIGTANQLCTTNSAITSVCFADVELPVAKEIKVLGVVLDRLLAFDKNVLVVTWSCSFHAQAICHICHLLSTDLAQTLACSLILTRLDYCIPVSSIQKLQCVQNSAVRIVVHAKPLLHQLHWLPVQHRIDYKVSVLTYKILNTSVPLYLSQHINCQVSARTLLSSAKPLLIQPFARTYFAKCSFWCAALSVWNSLPLSVIRSKSLSVFKSRLKTFLFFVGPLTSRHASEVTTLWRFTNMYIIIILL